MPGTPVDSLPRRAAVGLALAALLALPGADAPPPAGSTVPSDPVFTARMLRGAPVSGRIRQLGPRDEVVLVPVGGTDRPIPLRRVLELTRDDVTPAHANDGALVVFPRGDRLFRCEGVAANEMALEVQHPVLKALSIPLDSLLGVVLAVPSDPDELDGVLERVRTEPRSSEVLWLANGDRLAGGLVGLDDSKAKLQTDNGTVSPDRSGILALGFDPALVNDPRPEGLVLELTDKDGSRLGVTGARVEQGHVVATTRFGAAVRVPIGELVSIHVLSDAVSYLSEREPAKAQYVGYVGPTRPYRRDRNVDGHAIRLGGRPYDRGLGTQSRTFLAYRLAPGDQRFQATVGVDDAAGPLGSVVFRVLVDGKERFASPPMSVRDGPKEVDVDVAGAKLLVLVTEFGERGGVRDVADWAEARLVR